MKTPMDYADEPLTEHDWLQLKSCIYAGGSGNIMEWWHLRIAIAKVIKYLPKPTTPNDKDARP